VFHRSKKEAGLILTTYDHALKYYTSWPGLSEYDRDVVYQAISRTVFAAIKNTYPELAEECDRQLEDREE
jgi:hypothetical protein